ncbi:MAG: family 1 glycosylhydrolase [Actinomycetota bacterium]|nr:family 1 glycosylhydrolase [Actinomycetota bacterium]
MPHHDVDIVETSEHDIRFRDDLALMKQCGVTRLRYPIRWHRVEAEPGMFDWRHTDEVLGYLVDEGFSPIVDLLHHTSYPNWLSGFDDPRFASAYLRFCEAFALRHPEVKEYTLVNEPFTTLFLCGHEGIWPPYGKGMKSFVALARNLLPPLSEASRMYRDLLPEARHLYVEPCEGHSASVVEAEAFAVMANDRKNFVIDLLLGRELGPDRPFVAEVMAAGGEDLLSIPPGNIDTLGLDYYAHMEWSHGELCGTCPSPHPLGLAALILEYWDRYRMPLVLGETNIRGYASDRASWLKYTLEQCELAQAAGADLTAYCWFPFVDSLDWDSLLANADRHIDPVGVYWLDESLERHESVMSHAYCKAAAGARSSELVGYNFRPPLDEWLKGLLPQMSHWEWQEPPDPDSESVPSRLRLEAAP